MAYIGSPAAVGFSATTKGNGRSFGFIKNI